MFLEYEAVLTRAEQRLASGLSEEEVARVLAGLAALCQPVEVHYRWRPQLPDPGDEMVLEAAVNAGAEALVTFNPRDFAGVSSRFNLAVLRPADALGRHS